MAEGDLTNGTNGTHEAHELPSKPIHNNLALTEYTITPSPGHTTPREKIEHAGVPADYLLPTGYPDVSRLLPYIELSQLTCSSISDSY